jgi:hypothetical protein
MGRVFKYYFYTIRYDKFKPTGFVTYLWYLNKVVYYWFFKSAFPVTECRKANVVISAKKALCHTVFLPRYDPGLPQIGFGFVLVFHFSCLLIFFSAGMPDGCNGRKLTLTGSSQEV